MMNKTNEDVRFKELGPFVVDRNGTCMRCHRRGTVWELGETKEEAIEKNEKQNTGVCGTCLLLDIKASNLHIIPGDVMQKVKEGAKVKS